MSNVIHINEIDNDGSQDVQIRLLEAERGPAGRDGVIQYAAGAGIRIVNNVISATGGGGGGGDSPFIPLTNADGNYTEEGETYIALWKLPSGLYCLDDECTIEILVSKDGPSYGRSQTPFVFNTNGTSTGIYYDKTVIATNGVSVSSVNKDGFIDESKSQKLPLSDFGGASPVLGDGLAGLVPAPKEEDWGKFLNANGLWESINDGTLTIQQNGTTIQTFSADSATNKTANITSPVITMQTTDPGEGAPLSANNFIGVYGDSPIDVDYSLNEIDTGAKWVDGSAIYKKTINFGALPDTSQKRVQHNIANFNWLVRADGVALRQSDGTRFVLPYVSNESNLAITLVVTDTEVAIITGSNRTDLVQSYITIYYTKSS